MVFLLTSTGFSHKNITDKFLELIHINIKELKIAFIANAVTNDTEMFYAKKILTQLSELGIKADNITATYTLQELTNLDLTKFNIIVVSGGSTKTLLDQARKSGFNNKLLHNTSESMIYIGVSAGTVLLTPNINTCKDTPTDDFDYRGLEIINYEISVHTPELRSIETIEDYACKTGKRVVTMSDKSGILFNKGRSELIGAKESIFFN